MTLIRDRRTGRDRRKKLFVVPNQKLSDVIDTPDKVVNHLLLNHQEPLTWADVDVTFCTEDELLIMVANVIMSCKQLTLTDKEITKFWEVRQELQRRQYHVPLSS